MRQIEIVDTNSSNIGEFAFCGYKNLKQDGYRRKIDWLTRRFADGMIFKVLRSEDDGDIGFIEYIPGEYAWRAVEAAGYLVIHCLAIMFRKHRGKGYGLSLVEECLRDARRQKMRGAAVVVRKGTWMAGKEVFLKKGFEPVDKAAPDFELLVKACAGKRSSPKFPRDWENRVKRSRQGLTIFRSDQCPYIEKSVREITETAESKYNLKPRIIELVDCHQAQQAPSAFAIYGIINNGQVLADLPISNKRFMNIMDKIHGQPKSIKQTMF